MGVAAGSPPPSSNPRDLADVPLAVPWSGDSADDTLASASTSDETTAVDSTADSGAEQPAGAGLFEDSIADGGSTPGATSDAVAGAARHGWHLDLNGYVRGDVFVGKFPDHKAAQLKAGYGELALKVQVHKERYGDALAETRLRYGHNGEETTLAVDLREAYVNGYFGPVDIRLGHQILVWGRADGFNPTNNLTPFDLRIRSPIEDDRRLANLGARVFLNFAPVRIEGVWLPLYSPVLLPPVALDEYITLEGPTYPDTNITNSLGAGRFHLELPKFEMSASYLHGHAPLPGISLVGFGVGENAEARISRTAYDHHVAGFDFSTAIGDILGMRGEAAFRYPIKYKKRIQAPRPDLQYVFGLDREFGPVNIIAQYLGRYTLDWQQEGEDDPIDPVVLENLEESDLTPLVVRQVTAALNAEIARNNQILFWQLAPVQHLVSLRVQWLTLHDTLAVSALGMVNITTREYLIYPKVQYRITDRMLASVGGEIYVGPEGTLLDWIDETLSAAYGELKFLF